MVERMFRDVGDLFSHVADDIENGAFEMARKPNKVNEARQALHAMRHQAGMFEVCYRSIQATLDQAIQCLGNESITPGDADAVRSTLLQFHVRLQSATFDEADRIGKGINDERCRLLNLYYARENKLRGFAK